MVRAAPLHLFFVFTAAAGGPAGAEAAGGTAEGVPAPLSNPPGLTGSNLVRVISERLGHDVRWVKVAELLVGTHTSCVDGRDDVGVIGTPGGDTGEVVLALAAAERASGLQLEDAEVDAFIASELEAIGHLYLHTDRHALEHLRNELAAIPELAAYARTVGPELPAPPVELREAVIARLVEPSNVGCGHLRLVLQDPAAYGVRPEIPRRVLAAFYRGWFAGQEGLRFVVLDGGHEEGAVLVVQTTDRIHPYTRLPLIMPERRGTQLFVSHPQFASYLRRLETDLLLEQLPRLSRGGPTSVRLFRTIDALAARQLEITLQRLAAGLPVLELALGGGGGFEVRARGRVPAPPEG